MNVRIIELGTVGRETKGVPDPVCPLLEPIPKIDYRNVFSDVGV